MRSTVHVLFGTRHVAVTSVNRGDVAGSAEIAAYPDQFELTSGVMTVPARAVPATAATMPSTRVAMRNARIGAP